jgi:hypothetical protein
MGDAAYQAAKEAAAQAGTAAKPGTEAAGPGPFIAPNKLLRNFPGPSESDSGNGFFPPDSTGAVGGGYFVAPVNLTFNVFNKSTGASLLHVSYNALLGTSEQLSDPRVVYDPVWKRWVTTIITVPTSTSNPPACFWVAVSRNAAPTGNWIIYHPCVGGGVFANGDLWDYDILGMTQDAVLLTGNIFACCFTTYKGAAVVAIPKAKIYNSLGFSYPLQAHHDF